MPRSAPRRPSCCWRAWTSATYMSEVAQSGRRGFFASFQYVTLIGGQLLALLVLVVLQQLLSTEELKAWGWRIPFVLGACAVMTVALLVYMAMQPAFGALSDRIGRRTSMRWFGALIMAALAIVSLYTSIGGLIKAEMFPMEVRALGIGLSYAVANALFGGTAEYVALWSGLLK